ncbi:MAG TPA: hypothetical protein VKR56_08645 [Candidatus Cybelea sp.]|nr:hypothetical protein [Candidatus Cybelea sp.]
MISLLFAAAVSTGLTAERAVQLLERDYGTVSACAKDRRPLLRDALERRQVSKNPNIVLLTVYDSCVCFAQNCPFWVYRVGDRTATKILESVAVGVNVVPTGGAVPDIDFVAHESALRKNEWRYTYRNGTYVESEAWRIYRGDRKPVSIRVRFAPGTASARLSGTVGVEWGDEYAFDAVAGQALEISAVRAQRATVIRLQGQRLDQALMAGRPVTLPMSGRYTISVLPIGYETDPDSAYAFTLSIH